MTVDKALRKARKKHPTQRLGQLVYNAVVLSHPGLRPDYVNHESTITENQAKILGTIYSMTDAEMEKALDDMERNIESLDKRRKSTDLQPGDGQ
jgi:hypothetical protein